MPPDPSEDPGALAVWPPVGEPPATGPTAGRLVARALPAVAVALLMGWLTEPWVGALILVLALGLLVAGLASPRVARTTERVVAAMTHHVGRVLTFVVLGAVFALLFVPVALLARLGRRDPLTLGAGRSGTAWRERLGWAGRRLPGRTYASEQDLLGGRRAGRVVWAVGLVTVLLLADLAVGVALTDPATEGAPPPATGGGGPSAIPALAGLDYVPQLFTEQFAAESGRFDPLLGWRLEDTAGEHLTIADGERASTATTAPGDPVVVWFFGGSAMYGFGQRDGHTIPSELVRLAEADGVPLEVHNFGTPAYVNWQGVSLFAQLLTERPAPDVAVFYDGYNDLSMQLVDGPVTEPSHVLASVQQERVEAGPVTASATSAQDVRQWWADRSATVNLYRRLADRLGGADEPEVRLTDAEASAVPADVDPDRVAADAGALLGRGCGLARALGEAYGVVVQCWFQPTLYSKGPVEGERYLLGRAANRSPAWVPTIAALRAGFDDGVVDLADSLDGHPDPLFWDTVHTNETGAALVAEAAWPALRSVLNEMT